jgi:hypothetical protein
MLREFCEAGYLPIILSYAIHWSAKWKADY